jgi:hypothetical protein
MKKITVVLLFSIFCTGCVAHMMETHGDSIQLFKVPGQKQGRGGVIRYLNTGLDSFKRARRADAEKQMNRFCSGSYRIIEEGPRSKFGASMPIGKSVSFEVDEYTYVSFECVK